jgi:MarR family transcriptional regulator, organic hydroperoxide resistance regulator
MESDDSLLEIMKLFKELVSMIKQNMGKAFKESGITLPQRMVIGILSKMGRSKINELSTELNLSNSTVSGIIDRMEKQNIVVRERSKDDNRVVYVSLTPEFNQLHQDIHPLAGNNMQNFIKKGTPEELDSIIKGLTILKKLMSE